MDPDAAQQHKKMKHIHTNIHNNLNALHFAPHLGEMFLCIKLLRVICSLYSVLEPEPFLLRELINYTRGAFGYLAYVSPCDWFILCRELARIPIMTSSEVEFTGNVRLML